MRIPKKWFVAPAINTLTIIGGAVFKQIMIVTLATVMIPVTVVLLLLAIDPVRLLPFRAISCAVDFFAHTESIQPRRIRLGGWACWCLFLVILSGLLLTFAWEPTERGLYSFGRFGEEPGNRRLIGRQRYLESSNLYELTIEFTVSHQSASGGLLRLDGLPTRNHEDACVDKSGMDLPLCFLPYYHSRQIALKPPTSGADFFQLALDGVKITPDSSLYVRLVSDRFVSFKDVLWRSDATGADYKMSDGSLSYESRYYEVPMIHLEPETLTHLLDKADSMVLQMLSYHDRHLIVALDTFRTYDRTRMDRDEWNRLHDEIDAAHQDTLRMYDLEVYLLNEQFKERGRPGMRDETSVTMTRSIITLKAKALAVAMMSSELRQEADTVAR